MLEHCNTSRRHKGANDNVAYDCEIITKWITAASNRRRESKRTHAVDSRVSWRNDMSRRCIAWRRRQLLTAIRRANRRWHGVVVLSTSPLRRGLQWRPSARHTLPAVRGGVIIIRQLFRAAINEQLCAGRRQNDERVPRASARLPFCRVARSKKPLFKYWCCHLVLNILCSI